MMENALIIFPNPERENGLVFVYPAPNCGLTVEEVALKDVPAGTPFLLVPDEQAPRDHSFFEAFEADFSQPDGYGLGPEAFWAQKNAAANSEASE